MKRNLRVRFNREWEEYEVQVTDENLKRIEASCYYASDREDAEETLVDMKEEFEAKGYTVEIKPFARF